MTTLVEPGTPLTDEELRALDRISILSPPARLWLDNFLPWRRYYVAWRPNSLKAILRLKDDSRLTDWRTRRWITAFTKEPPLIREMTTPVLALIEQFLAWPAEQHRELVYVAHPDGDGLRFAAYERGKWIIEDATVGRRAVVRHTGTTPKNIARHPLFLPHGALPTGLIADPKDGTCAVQKNSCTKDPCFFVPPGCLRLNENGWHGPAAESPDAFNGRA